MVKVFLIEDELLFAEGFKFHFRSKSCPFRLIGYTNKINEAIINLSLSPPDIILLDLYLEKIDPLISFKTLHQHFHPIPIIIYSTETSMWWKWRLMLEGASGFVTKEWDVMELKDRISHVFEGHVILPGDLSNYLERLNYPEGLNVIDKEDLDLIRYKNEGLRNFEICIKMGKSQRAIVRRFEKLCKLFRVSSSYELGQMFFSPAIQ
jgi:DNA-binding NarL/FixJ family response regulator